MWRCLRFTLALGALDGYRIGRAYCLTMPHRLDVVSVGVEHECGVIAAVIGTKTRRPVVPAARLQRHVVETFDRGLAPGLEGEVKARGLGIGTVDVKLIDVEVVSPSPKDSARS